MIKETLHNLYSELSSGTTLVAVSKFHPFSSIAEAYAAGQRIFAESRPQELLAKQKELEELRSSYGDDYMGELKWHFIGHLQTNKLKMVLPYVTLVESVDSVKLLDAIETWGANNSKTTNVLLEYFISEDDTKQGLTREEILSILTGHDSYPHIVFKGLMGMATHTNDETIIRRDFKKIPNLVADITQLAHASSGKGSITVANIDPEHLEMSFGMSGDYKLAIQMGATLVRIGTKIFGPRTI